MRAQRISFIGIVSISLLWGLLGHTANAWSNEKVNHGLYGELLNNYVKHGVVDYRGFKKHESKLDRYLKVLEEVDSKTLSRAEQFAFYVNAYNAWTIKLILSGYPGVKSIKDLGSLFKSPWKKKICRIDGDIITLDNIEHDILRPRFRDPRVHFAVNCASKGCPPLRSEPYRGSTLDKQLDDSVSSAINNPARCRLERKILYLNKIFDWFSEDFEGGVVDFVLKYAKGDLKNRLEANKYKIKVKYINYDWSLNGQ